MIIIKSESRFPTRPRGKTGLLLALKGEEEEEKDKDEKYVDERV